MSEERTRIGETEALTFHGAFGKRREYMRAEGIDWLIDSEETVPLPGCPRCRIPAESVFWDLRIDGSLLVDVEPCGHRLVVDPITDKKWLT